MTILTTICLCTLLACALGACQQGSIAELDVVTTNTRAIFERPNIDEVGGESWPLSH